MKKALRLLLAASFAALPTLAQHAPAPVLDIIRETIKEGRNAAHGKVESEWAAYYRRTKAPGNYIALTTLSGPSEAWFITPLPSFAAREENDKAFQIEPLKSGNDALSARDGEQRVSSREVWSVLRPDLSYKAENFNPVKNHYYDLSTYHVKVGHELDFDAAVKTYMAAAAKAGLPGTFVCYQITMGAQAGTYMFFSGFTSLAGVDGAPERTKALAAAMGPEKFAAFGRSGADFLLSVDDTLLEVRPSMSYAPQSYIDEDSAFWKPGATARTASAPAPVTKPVTKPATK